MYSNHKNKKKVIILLISISMSADNSLPLTGSEPFSDIYFSINLFSKIDPDTGDTTGCSGTSFETTQKAENSIIYVLLIRKTNK